jgi:hypothetical protein
MIECKDSVGVWAFMMVLSFEIRERFCACVMVSTCDTTLRFAILQQSAVNGGHLLRSATNCCIAAIRHTGNPYSCHLIPQGPRADRMALAYLLSLLLPSSCSCHDDVTSRSQVLKEKR